MVNKEMLLKVLQDAYHELSATDNYIMVFVYGGIVYMTICSADMVNRVTCLDKASRGAGYSLRFKPNKAQKQMLLANGATALCSTSLFDHMVAESIYNRGEIAEKIVTEYFGQVWTKDNVPYTEAGDINVDGIEYQIKFEKATFTNEKSLAKMRKA